MNKENFLVSVIIPTYKRSETLLSTIDSVLCQTYKNIEVIVVDDNGLGTEYQIETQKRLSKYIDEGLITYIPHNVNKNGSAARNTGIAASKGVFINLLDDDDKLAPEKIEMQVEKLRNTDDSIGATYCNSLIIICENVTHRIKKLVTKVYAEGDLCREYLTDKARFNTSTILFKRDALAQLKGFDENFIRHQDFELMVRFFCLYKIVCTGPEPLVIYDVTSDRINMPNGDRDFMVKKYFLSVFESEFNRRGIYKEIAHHMWWNCAKDSLAVANYDVYKRSINLCRLHGRLSMYEVYRLMRSFIVGVLR